MKRCPKCKTEKPLAEFYATASYCKDCFRQSARRSKLRQYGLTEEQYEQMLAGQGGVCAICGAPPRPRRPLSIDHHHGTGRIRGLLCNNCNAALGCFRDSPELIDKAIVYIAHFCQPQ